MAKNIQIKEYIENNTPDLLIKALNSTLPQVIKSINEDNENDGCVTALSEILKNTACYDVQCHNCPFDKSIEEAKKWLRQ